MLVVAGQLRHTVNVITRPDEDGGYVAECVELPVVTEGDTLDELVQNIQDAANLALAGEDPAAYALADEVAVVLTYELATVHA